MAARERFRKVLVLGTRYLMEGPVYPDKLRAAGVAHEIPDAATRERINALTFDELVYGRFEEPTRAYFTGVIREFQERGADAVALACTEFPLLIGPATRRCRRSIPPASSPGRLSAKRRAPAP